MDKSAIPEEDLEMRSRGYLLAMLVAASGCGRLSFDPTAGVSNDALPGIDSEDGAATGHDEDGDGIPDAVDTCPHLPGPQLDSDGDGLGNACDPHPAKSGDHVLLFLTLAAGDVPFEDPTGDWTQDGDDQRLTDAYGDFRITLPQRVMTLRLAIGATIDGLAGPVNHQRQISMHGEDVAGEEQYFLDLNEVPPDPGALEVGLYTPPNTYGSFDPQPLATNIHTGDVVAVMDKAVGGQTGGTVTWPGESYTTTNPDALFTGAQSVFVNFNGLAVHLHYIWVATSD